MKIGYLLIDEDTGQTYFYKELDRPTHYCGTLLMIVYAEVER